MTYIYSEVDDLENTGKVGTHHCVALLQHYMKIPRTELWHEGEPLYSEKSIIILKGTAIATFYNGIYANRQTGNHAAFFISKDASGIWIMDQWKGDSKPRVSKRHIKKKGRNKKGEFIDPSNNAEAYSIIE